MKFKYLLMGVALISMASVTTSCSDDDNDAPVASPELTLPDDVTRVKIGPENRVPLPVVDGAGVYNAYSLNPDVLDVVKEGEALYLEGKKNGATEVMVSDAAGTYKTLAVSVYTTDVMTLSHTELTFNVPMGLSASTDELKVELGNGDYTAESDNERVQVSIDATTGEMMLRASAGKDPYTAVVTVTDASNLTATATVVVTPSFDPFTATEIEQILAQTESTLFGQCKDPSDGTQPYYFGYSYGDWISGVADGVRTIGWWMDYYGMDYGGLKVEFADGTPVDTEAAGKLYYQYSYIAWYSCYTYDGTVKLLEDSDERVVAIWWNVDYDNERINRAYFVQYK